MISNSLKTLSLTAVLATTAIAVGMDAAHAADLVVKGTDAIYLSGRTDVTIPDLGVSDPSFPLTRHGFVASDFLKETVPQSVAATGGQLFSFNASGCVNFYNGLGCRQGAGIDGFGADGNGVSGTNLNSVGGISGIKGPQGGLVGVFLNNSIPTGSPPAALDFTPGGLGTAFTNLAPQLGQVFFIGDGLTGTGSGLLQKFLAPTGATRLFLGIADGFGFFGAPGAYEDNDGSYKVSVLTEPKSVPEPATITGVLLAGGMATLMRRRRATA